jgi:hypothetical protein
MNNYLDFGIPISFGWTSQYLDRKTQTRREWKDSHATKFIKAYDRATAAGQQLRVPAIDKGYHAGGQQIGSCILTIRPYKEALNAMEFHDLNAEGGMCASVEEFTQKYFRGDGALEVWVINFVFVPAALERPFCAAARIAEDIEVGLGDENADEAKTQVENSVRWFEPDPEYDSDFDRELVIKRYLRLINSPTYYTVPIESVDSLEGRLPKSEDSKPENTPLPPYLIITGRRIVPYLKKKILGALALHSHCLGVKQKIDIHTLFYETKLFGYRYNYKSQAWDLDWNRDKPKKEQGLKDYE